MKRLGSKIKRISTKRLDLPVDVTLNLPRIIMVGFNQIYIENYHEVVRFTEDHLLLKLENKYIKIVGNDLKIRSILPEEIFIEGSIKKIDYIDEGDIA